MVQEQTLIVYGSDENTKLVKSIERSGFLPIIRGNILNILGLIRHRNFLAIIIDTENLKEDALELVLNVRDFDKKIPIIWNGKMISAYEKEVLKNQENLAIIKELTPERLRKEVRNMKNITNY